MKNKKTYMTTNDIDLLLQNIDLILKEYNTFRYDISYFGGEPLLNWEVLKYAYSKFSQDSRVYKQSMTTNLLLLDEEKMEFLNNSKIIINWSFDGLWQSENRPLRNSKSSYDIYLQKKDLLDKLKIQFLLTTVCPNNVLEMTKNLEYFVNTWKYFPSYHLAIDTVWTDSDINLFDKELPTLCDKYIELTKQGKYILTNSLFLEVLRNMLFIEKNKYKEFSCGAGTNQLAFLPDGIIYPCAMFGNNKKTPLWDFKNRIVYDENIQFAKNIPLVNENIHKQCQRCNLSSYCTAGCAYLNLYNKDGQINGKIPTYCKLYKIICRESLRMYEELKDIEIFQYLLRKDISIKFNLNEI
jgi:uncharacterized protein